MSVKLANQKVRLRLDSPPTASKSRQSVNSNMKHSQPASTPANRAPFSITVLHYFVWTLLAAKVCALFLIPALNQGINFGIWIKDGVMTMLDFPIIFNAVKRAWYGGYPAGISIYSAANKVSFVSEWSKQTYVTTYSPAILLLLAPLVPLSHGAAFFLFNIAGLFFIWWQTFPKRCRRGIALLIYFGPLGMACFSIGQTALATGAGLLYLYEKTRRQSGSSKSVADLLAGIVLWFLTAKPPLALTAAAIIIGMRRWRVLLLAAIMAIAGTQALTPLLGPWWLHDYWLHIVTYNRHQADFMAAQLLNPSHMASLRAVLSVNAGVADHIASKISLLAWLPMLLLIAIGGKRLRLTDGALWAIGILSYLAFCPHLTSTEELQLLLLIPLCVPADTATPLRWQETLLLVAVCLLPFTSPAVGPFDNRLLMFLGKLALAVFIAVYWREDNSPLTRPAATLSPEERESRLLPAGEERR